MSNSINVLVLGSDGGIGSSICNLLNQNKNYLVTAFTRNNLDVSIPEQIFATDLSSYDIVINCTGHSHGTFQGFLKNSWQNQLDQIMTNYVGNLFILKNYAISRAAGKYVWISSSSVDNARPFHSVYAGTKAASKFSIDLIQQEATHIGILEIKVGLVKTKFRGKNFLGTKSKTEIDEMYANENALSADYVAEQIILAIESNQQEAYIT